MTDKATLPADMLAIIESKENHAQDQAAAQYESIIRMLAALTCDYDRLEELRDERDSSAFASRAGLENPVLNGEWWEDHYQNEAEELAQLEGAAGECTDQDDALQRIMEDPLEVQVRSDWTTPGEELESNEFMILLCTGGPAVRIVGELNMGEPCRAWIEYQDWGTPWTRYCGASSDNLCQYASNFFFGE
jgi:hypothetical protein